MKRRPTSITIIAWLLITSGAISVVPTVVAMNNSAPVELMPQNHLPVPILHVMSFAQIAVVTISGIAMLNGRNWSRFLYVIWSIFEFIVVIATSPMKMMMVPGLVFFILIAFFLFRPAATEYFLSEETSDDA